MTARLVTTGLIGVVAMTATLWVFVGAGDAEPEHPSSGPSPPLGTISEPLEDRSAATDTVDEGDATALETDDEPKDLAYHCPTLRHGRLVPGCLDALDRTYLTRETYSGDELVVHKSPIMELPNPMTWDRIFEDPVAKHRRIADALADDACLLPHGTNAPSVGWRPADGGFSPGLAERCAADAMAEMGTLKIECGGDALSNRRDLLRREVREMNAAMGLDHIEDTPDYWRERRKVEDAHYRHAWLVARCLAVPVDAWKRFDAFEGILKFPDQGAPWADAADRHEVFARMSSSWDKRWIQYGIAQRVEGHRLVLNAARLGSEWALTQMTWIDPDLVDELDAINPVLGQILRIKNDFAFVDSINAEVRQAYRHERAQEAMRLAQANDVVIDTEALMRLVTGSSLPRFVPRVVRDLDEPGIEFIRNALRDRKES